MDYFYNEDYSITFRYLIGGSEVTRNTWTDYKLIPKSRPFVAPPSVKTTYLDIPGLNGKLDFTDSLLGRPGFGNRSGSWEFIFSGDYNPGYTGKSPIDALVFQLRKDLNGNMMNVILEGDPGYFYRGRVQVSEIVRNNDGSGNDFTLDYNFSPYKYSTSVYTYPSDATVGTNFNRPVHDIYVNGSTSLLVTNHGSAVIATVYASASGMSVVLNNRVETGSTFSLYAGRNEGIFRLAPGLNTLDIYGTGRFQLCYSEGRM